MDARTPPRLLTACALVAAAMGGVLLLGGTANLQRMPREPAPAPSPSVSIADTFRVPRELAWPPSDPVAAVTVWAA